MSGPRGYNSYRGKGSKWKTVAAVFLVLVILAAVAVIRLQKFIVYDDSGKPRLELPQTQQEPDGSAAAEPDSSVPDLIIQEPERQSLRAVRLAVEPLRQWPPEEGGMDEYNGVCYTAKDAEGNVYFNSQLPLVKAVKTEEGSAAAIAELTGSETYTIARMACFRDTVTAVNDIEEKGLKNTGGYIFYDGNSDCWLDPGKPAAREYLCSLAVELAQRGFDEILLTELSYPTEGKLDKIDYGASATGLPDSLSANLALFLTEMRAALEEYEVTLSIELSPDALGAGEDTEHSGQRLSALAPLVDRIYADAGDDADAAERMADRVAGASAKTDFIPEWTGEPVGQRYLKAAP